MTTPEDKEEYVKCVDLIRKVDPIAIHINDPDLLNMLSKKAEDLSKLLSQFADIAAGKE